MSDFDLKSQKKIVNLPEKSPKPPETVDKKSIEKRLKLFSIDSSPWIPGLKRKSSDSSNGGEGGGALASGGDGKTGRCSFRINGLVDWGVGGSNDVLNFIGGGSKVGSQQNGGGTDCNNGCGNDSSVENVADSTSGSSGKGVCNGGGIENHENVTNKENLGDDDVRDDDSKGSDNRSGNDDDVRTGKSKNTGVERSYRGAGRGSKSRFNNNVGCGEGLGKSEKDYKALRHGKGRGNWGKRNDGGGGLKKDDDDDEIKKLFNKQEKGYGSKTSKSELKKGLKDRKKEEKNKKKISERGYNNDEGGSSDGGCVVECDNGDDNDHKKRNGKRKEPEVIPVSKKAWS